MKALSLVAFWIVLVQPASARICMPFSSVNCYIVNHVWSRLDDLGFQASTFTNGILPGATAGGSPRIEVTYTFPLPLFYENELDAVVASKQRELAAFSDATGTELKELICDWPEHYAEKSRERRFVEAGGVIIYIVQLKAYPVFTKINEGRRTTKVVEIARVTISSCEAP